MPPPCFFRLKSRLIRLDLYPTTTHVICGKCTQSEFAEFKEYNKVHIVSLAWLFESIRFKKMVLEEEYKIKPSPNPKPVSYVHYNSHTQGFESFTYESASNMRIEGKDFTLTKSRARGASRSKLASNFEPGASPALQRSKSMMPRTSKRPSKPKIEIKFRSLLFKNCYFFFEIGVSGMSKYKRMVIENSGSILTALEKCDQLELSRDKKIYLILKDGKDSSKYKAFKDKIMPVSPRFIEFCVQTKLVIKDPSKEKLIHLLPFPHKTPCPNFDRIRVFVKGFDLEKNSSLMKTAGILGFEAVEEQEEAMLVIMDSGSYKKRKGRPGVVYKRENWLLKCLTLGVLSDDVMKVFGIEKSG